MFVVVIVLFFFFKQKTAYEMRISDWSSDVCSSDLRPAQDPGRTGARALPVAAHGTAAAVAGDDPQPLSANHPAASRPQRGAGLVARSRPLRRDRKSVV